MSIIYDFKSINANLRGDNWYEPKVEWRPAEPELDIYEAWRAEHNRRQAAIRTTKFACNWCLDLGFPTSGAPCAICKKVYT